MKKTLKLKIDGYSAEFEEESQVEIVEYLNTQLSFWRDIARTHKRAIDSIDTLLHNNPLERK